MGIWVVCGRAIGFRGNARSQKASPGASAVSARVPQAHSTILQLGRSSDNGMSCSGLGTSDCNLGSGISGAAQICVAALREA